MPLIWMLCFADSVMAQLVQGAESFPMREHCAQEVALEMVLMVALQVLRVVALEVAIEVDAVVAQVSPEVFARLT